MTEQKLGKPESARKWLARADEYATQHLSTVANGRASSWNRAATLKILQKEANQVLMIAVD
jgi:hypothetical protein